MMIDTLRPSQFSNKKKAYMPGDLTPKPRVTLTLASRPSEPTLQSRGRIQSNDFANRKDSGTIDDVDSISGDENPFSASIKIDKK